MTFSLTYLGLFLRSRLKVKVHGHRIKQQQPTSTASPVRMVNVYAAGGLWRTKLNYDGNNSLYKQLRTRVL